MKIKYLVIALLVLVVAGVWWMSQQPTLPDIESIPTTEDSSSVTTQLADSVENAETISFANNETDISVTFTPEQATLTGLGYADVSLDAVPAASGARYESADPALVVWNKGEEVTVYQDDEIIFTGTSSSENESIESTQSGDLTSLLTAETWVWQETQMNNGDVIDPNEAEAFTLTFTDDGQVSGTTDCNSINGQYELNDTSIEMGPFAMTRMYCEGSQEQEFVDVLTEADLIFFDDADNLVLLLPYDSGSVIFTPETN